MLSMSTMFAQDDKPTNYKHQAGFTMGTFFGLAPTYRYHFTSNNALQVSVLPLFNDGEFRYTASAGYLRKLSRSEFVDLSFVSSVTFADNFVGELASLSMGTQADFKLSRFLTFEARLGLLASTTFNDETRNTLAPSGGISLMYNFVE